MPTQRAIRRACEAAFNDAGFYGCSAASSSNITLAATSDSTTNASAQKFNGAWIYAINQTTGVGQQRRVVPGGFVPASGILGIELNWSVTPTLSDEVEITHLFPVGEGPTQIGGISPEDASYNSLINRALSMIVAPDRVGLAITTDQFYSTVAWVEWLDRPDRVVRNMDGSLAIWEPGVRGGLPQNATWRGWTLRLDAETPGLEVNVPFSASSGTLYLDVMRPADTWVGTSGIWAESTTGMTNNFQEVRAPINDVVKVFKMLAIEALMARSPGRPSGNWAARYPSAVRDARSVRYFDRSQESMQAQSIPEEEAA